MSMNTIKRLVCALLMSVFLFACCEQPVVIKKTPLGRIVYAEVRMDKSYIIVKTYTLIIETEKAYIITESRPFPILTPVRITIGSEAVMISRDDKKYIAWEGTPNAYPTKVFFMKDSLMKNLRITE